MRAVGWRSLRYFAGLAEEVRSASFPVSYGRHPEGSLRRFERLWRDRQDAGVPVQFWHGRTPPGQRPGTRSWRRPLSTACRTTATSSTSATQQLPDAGPSGSVAFHATSRRRRQSIPRDRIMTVVTPPEVAGSSPTATKGGSLPNPRWISPQMCAIPFVRSAQFSLDIDTSRPSSPKWRLRYHMMACVGWQRATLPDARVGRIDCWGSALSCKRREYRE